MEILLQTNTKTLKNEWKHFKHLPQSASIETVIGMLAFILKNWFSARKVACVVFIVSFTRVSSNMIR